MSWLDRPSLHRPLALGTAIVAAVLPAAALAGIVVAASGPSAKDFPPGRKLADNATITLKAADSVTILDAKGTRVLKGAGSFTVGAPAGASKGSTFAALTQQRDASRVRTGAVRAAGPDGKPLRPNLWYVDVTVPGPVCVVAGMPIRAWRPEMDGEGSYSTVTVNSGRNGGKRAPIAFADKSTVAAWDVASAPVQDGATYAVTDGKEPPVDVTFAVLPRLENDPERLASDLLAHGCQGQLAVLTHALALPSDGASDGPAAPPQ
ncbi:hypothetical protein WBP07_02435 [Novosphingobium sp. BL-8A]|uniref:hypothetical protein n=1 Tax=Novosphingobium sp. BL-8A TaxID=3127639 RepID=UPI003756BB48